MDFGNSSNVRSPFSPRVRQSLTGRRHIGSASAKKNQNKFDSSIVQGGDIVYKSQLITLETYGAPLPVLVTETLTFANTEVTARISPCGWCWIVCGRKLLVWSREPTGSGAVTLARELTLPQTDLQHKADLVLVFYENGAQMPCCIGVSPEGTVRYWPSVAAETVYSDHAVELAGQECWRIVQAGDRCVLATTTCSTLILDCEASGVRWSTTREARGWRGGLGVLQRRVSSLLFGAATPASDQHNKLVGLLTLPGSETEDPMVCLVSRGPTLQCWRLPSASSIHNTSMGQQGSTGGLQEIDLRRPLAEALAKAHLLPHGEMNTVEIGVVDVAATGPDSVAMLLAVACGARPHELSYSVVRIDVLGGVVSGSARACCGGCYLVPLERNSLLVCSPQAIALLSDSSDKLDILDVSCEGDRILGASLCGSVPILLSHKHGLLAITTTSPMLNSPSLCSSAMSPSPSDMYDGNLSLYEIDPHEISKVTTDACGKLKTAFLFHIRRDVASCKALIEELFPSSTQQTDGMLDRTVIKIATEMLDDIPAGDPRWQVRGSCTVSVPLGSSCALRLEAQLSDKRRALALFTAFLLHYGIYPTRSCVSTDNGEYVSTHYVMCELVQLLAIAIELRNLQQGDKGAIIDAAIHQVSESSGYPIPLSLKGGNASVTPLGLQMSMGGDQVVSEEQSRFAGDSFAQAGLSSGALTAADVWYRRVSQAHTVPVALARARSDPATTLHAVSVLVEVIRAMRNARECQTSRAEDSGRGMAGATAAVLEAAQGLHTYALTECSARCPTGPLRPQLWQICSELAGLLLAEESLQASPRYPALRTEIITPYVKEGQLERASALAEKYKDFTLLVEMCVDSDDYPRLHDYIEKYMDEGLAEKAFAWMWSRGGEGQASLIRKLGLEGPPGVTARLASWLPPKAAALLALSSKRHALAANLVAPLKQTNVQSASVAASLGKLCLWSAEPKAPAYSETWKKLEQMLTLTEQHEALPRDIRIHNGLDDNQLRSPDELINMYIESESTGLTEFDYKKALDLTQLLDDEDLKEDLIFKVWVAAARQSSWTHEDPLDNTFSRLATTLHLLGSDVVIPALEELLSTAALEPVAADPQKHFAIKYCYETLQQQLQEA